MQGFAQPVELLLLGGMKHVSWPRIVWLFHRVVIKECAKEEHSSCCSHVKLGEAQDYSSLCCLKSVGWDHNPVIGECHANGCWVQCFLCHILEDCVKAGYDCGRHKVHLLTPHCIKEGPVGEATESCIVALGRKCTG